MVGNTTLMIGAEDKDVERIREIISMNCKTREKTVSTTQSLGMGLNPDASKVKITVGGASIFVLNVDSFEKI